MQKVFSQTLFICFPNIRLSKYLFIQIRFSQKPFFVQKFIIILTNLIVYQIGICRIQLHSRLKVNRLISNFFTKPISSKNTALSKMHLKVFIELFVRIIMQFFFNWALCNIALVTDKKLRFISFSAVISFLPLKFNAIHLHVYH